MPFRQLEMVSLSQHLFALRLFTIELGEIVECCIGLGIELAASAILTDVGDFPRASPWSKTHRLRRVAVGSFRPPINFLAFCHMLLGQGRYQGARIGLRQHQSR